MEQEFEWDEDKRLINIQKPDMDFRDARQLFDGRPILTISSSREDEQRFVSTGFIGEKIFTAIWTLRDSTLRLISVRRVRHAEERAYREVHGRRA